MVSFIITNYNTANLVIDCAESIARHICDTQYEIIVVDNLSAPADREKLAAYAAGNFHIIFSKQNLGFGGGNMLGAQMAKGDYLCFINSDVIFEGDCVTPLIRRLQAEPEIGCITPQQYSGDREPVRAFNHKNGILYEICSKRLLEKMFPNKYPSRKKVYTHPFRAHHINGCFMLFSEKTFWEAGGFDWNIFLYGEEYDVAMRLKNIGKVCVVDPLYGFVHLHGQSTKSMSKATRREGFISQLYVYRKYHSYPMYIIYKLVVLLKLIPNVKRWYFIPTLLFGDNSRSMRHKEYT